MQEKWYLDLLYLFGFPIVIFGIAGLIILWTNLCPSEKKQESQ